MGILNLTPDSFYPGSRLDSAAAADAAVAMVAAGADLLDLGAESSRPGSRPVGGDEERRRLLPALDAIRRRTDAPVSVDTVRTATARAALDAGADAINDISAGTHDPSMLELIAERGCGCVLMHMQGTPETMQCDPRYDDVVAEVGHYLSERAAVAEAAGISPARIVVDPGLGFGKTLEHNLQLLAALERVAGGRRLLVGGSRKGMIGMVTGAPVEARLPGSLAVLAAARRGDATVVRVHDVAESVQFLEMLAAIDMTPNAA
jgi:dihydropteroate synthase